MILIHACMQISKYHAVALHFTCMGTSCILGVSARHGFEQAVFLGRLSTIIIGVYPIKIYRRVVHSIIGVCPMKKISKGGPTFYRSLSNEPSRELKQKSFVLEIVFIHGKMHV